MAWGILNGFLVAKAKVPALIVTLGSLSVALGLAQVLTGGIDVRSVPEALTDFNTYIKIVGIPALPFVALVTVVIGGIVLHKTKFGRYTFAIGSNELGARRVGINVDRHLILVYGLSGAMAGLGAVLALSQFGTTTIAGQSLTNLNVIAAVVIGGTSIFGGEGSIFGTVIGLFIPAVLQAGFVIIGVEAFWQGVAVGTVLVAGRLRRPVPPGRRAARRKVPCNPSSPSSRPTSKDPPMKRIILQLRRESWRCRGGLFQLEAEDTPATGGAVAGPPPPSRHGVRPTRRTRTTTSSSSRAFRATSSTSRCSAALEAEAKSSASRSRPRARRSSTPPCRSRSSTR
jgi:hypothetical protein